MSSFNDKPVGLIDALEKKAPYDIILQLIEESPEKLSEKNKSGQLLLHYACEKDVYGRFPLHYLCNNSIISIELFNLIYIAFKEAVFHHDIYDNLPLHILCKNKAACSSELLSILINANPEALYQRNNATFFKQQIPINIAVQNNLIDKCIIMLIKECSLSILEENFTLHEAIFHNCSIEIIDEILKKSPELAFKIDSEKNMPFFYTCYRPKINCKVVISIFDANPEAIHEYSCFGNLFHLLCESVKDSNVIKHILSIFPDLISVKDKEGNLPLHSACKRNKSIEVIKILVSAYRKALRKKNKKGDTPFFKRRGRKNLKIFTSKKKN